MLKPIAMFSKAKKNILSSVGNTKLGRKAILNQVDADTQQFIALVKEVLVKYYGHEKGKKGKKLLLKFAVKFDNAVKEKKITQTDILKQADVLGDALEELLVAFNSIRLFVAQNEDTAPEVLLENEQVRENFALFSQKLVLLSGAAEAIFFPILSEKNQKNFSALVEEIEHKPFLEAFLLDMAYSSMSVAILEKSLALFGDVGTNLIICAELACEKVAAKLRNQKQLRQLSKRCAEHQRAFLTAVQQLDPEKRLFAVLGGGESAPYFVAFLEQKQKAFLFALAKELEEFASMNNVALRYKKAIRVLRFLKENVNEQEKLVLLFKKEIEDKLHAEKVPKTELDKLDAFVKKELKEAFLLFLASEEHANFLQDASPL